MGTGWPTMAMLMNDGFINEMSYPIIEGICQGFNESPDEARWELASEVASIAESRASYCSVSAIMRHHDHNSRHLQ